MSKVIGEHSFTAMDGMLGAYKRNNDVYCGDIQGASSDKLSGIMFHVLFLDDGGLVIGSASRWGEHPNRTDSGLEMAARQDAINRLMLRVQGAAA